MVQLHLKRICLSLGILLCCLAVLCLGRAAAAGGAEGVDLPIVMYHSILKESSIGGAYILSPEQLERDLIYIREQGYTPVLMKDVIAYVEEPEAVLPEKPILLTFDDGSYNNYLYVLPLMEQYGMRCVFSIVGRYTDAEQPGAHQSSNYSYLNWEQVKELSSSGRVEIQNHSYNLHIIDANRTGARIRPGETVEQYRALLEDDVGRLQTLIQEHTGILPTTFAYPYGKYSEESEPLLWEMGFKATLSCAEGVSRIEKGGSLSLLKRYNRAPGQSSAEFFKGMLN